VSSPEMPVPSAATPASDSANATKGFPTMLIAMILLSVGLAAIAQLALKHGMNRVNDVLAEPLADGRIHELRIRTKGTA